MFLFLSWDSYPIVPNPRVSYIVKETRVFVNSRGNYVTCHLVEENQEPWRHPYT